MSVRSGVPAGETADMHGQRPCKPATSTFTRPAEFPATRRADIPRYPGKRKSLDTLLATSFGPVPHPVKHHDFGQFLARARAHSFTNFLRRGGHDGGAWHSTADHPRIIR
jgi:hypothetical protein